MKIFNETLSEYLGYFIIVFFAFIIGQTIATHFNLAGIAYSILYLIAYFIIYAICLNIVKFSCLISYYSFYKLAILLLLPVFWFNIAYSIKFIKIMNILSSKKDLNKLTKYFDDSDNRIQLIALWLCAKNYDQNLTIKWYEENFINKNLTVNSYFYPLYKELFTPYNENA